MERKSFCTTEARLGGLRTLCAHWHAPDIWSFVGTACCCCKLQTVCPPPEGPRSHPRSRQSRRHRDIILLAFCQPSCHIRFALPRNKLTGATQQQLTRQGSGAGAEGGAGVGWADAATQWRTFWRALHASLDLHLGRRRRRWRRWRWRRLRCAKSLIVAQFSSYCISRSAFQPLPTPLIPHSPLFFHCFSFLTILLGRCPIAVEFMYSFICHPAAQWRKGARKFNEILLHILYKIY